MSGDGNNDVKIPSLFLFSNEGKELLWEMRGNKDLIIFMGDNQKKPIKEGESESQLSQPISGAEIALFYNPEQLVNVVSPQNSSKANHNLKDLLGIQQGAKTCPKHFYTVLEEFYTIYNHAVKPADKKDKLQVLETVSETIDSNENELVRVIDETIHLVIHSPTELLLEINLDPILSVDLGKLEGEALVSSVFFQLLERFEKRTNIGELNNREVYKQTLLNTVRHVLDPIRYKSLETDKVFLKALAGEIKSVDEHQELKIISRKKRKSSN